MKKDKRSFDINTDFASDKYNVNLENILDEKTILSLLGWKRTYLAQVKKISCCLVETTLYNLIIPHYVIGIYYYFRSTSLREAVLKCSIEDLYIGYDCNSEDALITLPSFISVSDAPFIHRFLCQKNAKNSFEDIGKFILAYLRHMNDKYPDKEIEAVPIKAKFPTQELIEIDVRSTDFGFNKKPYSFIHEITNDTSSIGFSKLMILTEVKRMITKIDETYNLPTLKKLIPGQTTEILKTQNASKMNKQHNIATNIKRQCNSLSRVQINTQKITSEEAAKFYIIYEDMVGNEEINQSLTESSLDGDEKIRKVKVSSVFEGTIREYLYNFDEFNQYIDFIRRQEIVQNLKVQSGNKIEMTYYEDGTLNRKSIIRGRERQYITATFKYKEVNVGLLELENDLNIAVSTWVFISKNIIDKSVFDKFLSLYINYDKSIEAIKKDFKNSKIKFHTKNHERNKNLSEDDKIRWVAGLLRKINLS